MDWSKCISFSADNAPNMLGKKKGVASYLSMENPNIIIRGCPCHLLQIAAKKSSSVFKIDFEMLLVDIFYFLDKSSKRKHNFKEQQKLCGQEKPHKILKYSSTRWLSLFSSIDRVLEQWEPLKEFFNDESNAPNNERFLKIKSSIADPKVKLILLFLHSTLPLFVNLNLTLQQEAPIIHKVFRNLKKLYMDLLVRFVQPTIISSDDAEFDYSNKNFQKKSYQKIDENLVIGVKTRMLLNESKLKEEDSTEFYDQVRKFFVKACSYIQEKLLTTDDFLKHAEVADVSLRSTASFSSILYFIKNHFSFLISENELENLEIEFAHYQADALEDIQITDDIDSVWFKISKMTDFNGAMKYKLLSSIMFSILTIPHSNASCERVFSLVRKNQTDYRPNLGRETLEALLVEKVNMSSLKEECFKKKISEKELKAAKSSTTSFKK